MTAAAHGRMTQLRVLAALALRNLRRHARRTLLTASAMILGAGLLILSFSLADGGQEQWIRAGVRMGAGHVTVEHPGFRTSRKIEDRLTSAIREAAFRAVEASEISPHVVAASERLSFDGLASSPAGARRVRIAAVDPRSETIFGTLDDNPVEGRYLAPGDRLLAYVGAGLASGLDLKLGSRFVVQAQDAGGDISGQLLRVVGLFRTGVTEIDQSTIHIPLATAGDWLGTGRDVTGVGLLLADSTVVEAVAAALERGLQGPVEQGHARVMTWSEADPALSSAIAIDDLGNYMTQLLLFTIIAFGVMNTVLMSVLHRHREFGVLQALGLTPGQTGTIVLIEGLALTVISGGIGVGLGLLGTWYVFGDGLDISGMMGDMTFAGVVIDPVIRPAFRPGRVFQALGFIAFVGALASIYPAVRAARIDVTEAMKFDR